MPKKKLIGHIHFRLKPGEAESLEADRKALPGLTPTASAYAKNAVMSYPKLRKLEDALRETSQDAAVNGDSADAESIYASAILKEAGL